eukprot:4003030-Karenia_brevis.AAC.1
MNAIVPTTTCLTTPTGSTPSQPRIITTTKHIHIFLSQRRLPKKLLTSALKHGHNGGRMQDLKT